MPTRARPARRRQSTALLPSLETEPRGAPAKREPARVEQTCRHAVHLRVRVRYVLKSVDED